LLQSFIAGTNSSTAQGGGAHGCGSQDSEDYPEYEAFEHLRANFNYLI